MSRARQGIEQPRDAASSGQGPLGGRCCIGKILVALLLITLALGCLLLDAAYWFVAYPSAIGCASAAVGVLSVGVGVTLRASYRTGMFVVGCLALWFMIHLGYMAYLALTGQSIGSFIP